jgi:Protein of unknown function (DUF4232)
MIRTPIPTRREINMHFTADPARGRALAAVVICAAALSPAAAIAAPAARTAAASVSTAPCATAGLVVWLNTQGDNAAGSSYYSLKFTNLSGHSCTLRGYPGVSAVDLQNAQVGSAGARDPSTVSLVQLANGATASAVLRITVAGNFPVSSCHSVLAAGLRIYPPGQTASKVIPFPLNACSKAGPVYLSIKAVT